MKVTLIISTYNRPPALNVVLDSVMRQTRRPDEIVVCDDGSRDDTRQLIESWRTRTDIPIKHVWQPDDGFRVAAARNRGVAIATGDYIVQIDGDIMMERHFIADHLSMAAPGHYIRGSRVRLSKKATQHICDGGYAKDIGLLSLWVKDDRLKNFRAATIGRRISRIYKTRGLAMGCNMSYWREDFMRVNGYDENFVGWGVEDSDLGLRMEASGVKGFKLFRMAICHHLHHREEPKDRWDEALKYMYDRIDKGIIYAERGVDQYIDKNETGS